MDLATIGLKADSTSIVKGTKDLDALAASSKRADAANNNFAGSATKAAKATDQIGKSANLATRGFGLLKGAVAGALAAIVGIGLASFSLKKFVDATSEAEAVQAQLAAALKSTHGVSGQTVASLNEQSKALQNLTTFGDEAIGTAQSILLTFTKIGGDVFPRATEAVANLATRMGGDLNGAALQIGKALNAPIQGITALSRAGIQFTQAQKDLIKASVESGNTLKAQEIILKELETQFGGSALAARETLGGAVEALGQAFGDLFELSGPATESLRTAIERVITAIQDPAFIAFVNLVGTTLFTALSIVVQVLSTLAGVIPIIAQALLPLAPLMIAAFGPSILLAVTALGQGITVSLINTIKTLFIILLANPFTAFLAAAVVVLSFMVDWQKSIKALIQLWALFVIAWNQFWGNEAGVQRGLKIGLDAGDVVAKMEETGAKVSEALKNGIDFGADVASPKLTNAMVAGGDAAAGKIGAAVAMTGQQAQAQWEQLNGKVIKPLGDTLIDGGKFIHNEVTGAITKGTGEAADALATKVRTGGEGAAAAMKQGVIDGGKAAGSQIFSTVQSAFATLAPLIEVFKFARLQMFADINKTQAEATKLLAEADKARADAKGANFDATHHTVGGGSSGGATSGGSGGPNSGGIITGRTQPAAPSSLFMGDSIAPSQRDEMNKFGWGINAGSFARGGTFRVPGTGSGDTKRVSFQATPGEKVTVEPLASGGAGNKTDLKIINNFNPRDMLSAITTSEGQREFVNIIQANRDTIQAILGVQ